MVLIRFVHEKLNCTRNRNLWAAVNELGRRLMLGESVTTFDLAAEGKKLRAPQASEILALILTEGLYITTVSLAAKCWFYHTIQ